MKRTSERYVVDGILETSRSKTRFSKLVNGIWANFGVFVAGAGVLALVTFVVGPPVMLSGYFFDDIWNSQIPIALRVNNVGFWEAIWAWTRAEMENKGRFFPLTTFETYAIFTLFPERISYKAVQLAVVSVRDTVG